MKRINLLCLLFISVFTYSQPFRVNDPYIDAQMETVEWLCHYDYIAYSTSGEVNKLPKEQRQGLGLEWFCIETDTAWHAFYGTLVDEEYQCKLHYTVSPFGDIQTKESTNLPDSLNTYAKALRIAFDNCTPKIENFGLKINPYIRKTNNGLFEVYILPALQPSGLAVYDMEFYYLIDETGDKILKTTNRCPKEIRGYKVDPNHEIWLDYTHEKQPTLGALFFGWYFKTYFRGINIETKKLIYAPVNMNNQWDWYYVKKHYTKP